MIKKICLAIFSAFIIVSSFVALPASAACPVEGWSDDNDYIICGGNNNEDKLMSTIGNVLNTIYGLIAIIAVVMIVIAGVKYMTSQGDPGKVAGAKNTIMYAIIGLIIVIFAFAITNFVLGALKG